MSQDAAHARQPRCRRGVSARPAAPAGVCRHREPLRRAAAPRLRWPSTVARDTNFLANPRLASLLSPNCIPGNTKQGFDTNCSRLGSPPKHDQAPASGRSFFLGNKNISRAPARESLAATSVFPENPPSQGPASPPFLGTISLPCAVRQSHPAVALRPCAPLCSVPVAATLRLTPVAAPPSASPRQTCRCLGPTT